MRSRRKRGRLGRRLLAAALGVLLAALCLELGLQLAGLALRGADAERVERDGPLAERRVLCLGACYTVGIGSPPDQSYPSYLERIIAERSGLEVSVINGGVRGKSVAFFARHIEEMLRETRPQILIVNVNDRLIASARELAEAERGEPWQAADRLLRRSLLYRAVTLLRADPEAPSALPRQWWSPGGGDEDFLAQQIARQEAALRERPEDPELWAALAASRAERLDYRGAVEATRRAVALRGEERDSDRRLLLDGAVGLRRYAEAGEILERMRADPAAGALMLRGIEDWGRSELGVEDRLHRQLMRSKYEAIYGDLQEAIALAEGVVAAMPGKVDAGDWLDFCRALARGGALPEQAAIREAALFTKAERAADGAGRLGLYPEGEAPLEGADEETLGRYYRQALDGSLRTIAEAAEPHGVQIVVENLSSLPAQQDLIREVCRRRDLPLVDLQAALAEHPRRRELLHPQQNLRLSPEGNRFIAETLYRALVDQGLL